MEGIIMAAQLLLALSIMVGLHEMGHLLAAKLFKMRVEKYSIGFPPKIFGFKWGETEYSLGALPLGGFVKISGMVDESLDTKNLDNEPAPWEFRAKPAWQRLIVMLGGIIVNVITGIVISILLLFIIGEKYISYEELNKNGITPTELGKSIGLENGDKIIDINGEKYTQYKDLFGERVLFGSNSYYTVTRSDSTFKLHIPNNFADNLAENKENRYFVIPRAPFKIGGIQENSGAANAGLKKEDKIVGIEGENIAYYDEAVDLIKANAGKKVTIDYMRNGEKYSAEAQISDAGMLGFFPEFIIKEEIKKYSFFEAIPKGTYNAFHIVWVQIKALGKIFRGELSASKSLAGPIGIAKEFGGTWNWVRFWTLIGFLSMVLAFMNLLPIPALDGGHVVFLLFEMITGKKPSDKFMEIALKIGMVILLGLIIFVIGNDLFKVFF